MKNPCGPVGPPRLDCELQDANCWAMLRDGFQNMMKRLSAMYQPRSPRKTITRPVTPRITDVSQILDTGSPVSEESLTGGLVMILMRIERGSNSRALRRISVGPKLRMKILVEEEDDLQRRPTASDIRKMRRRSPR
jgi:hypothetical protein